MPTIRLRKETMDLIRSQPLPPYRFVHLASELEDGSWSVPVDDEAAFAIERQRLRGESDEDVVLRLVSVASGCGREQHRRP